MKLYIGGAYQGQTELAQEENPGILLYRDFHETIRQAVLTDDQDPLESARVWFR